MRAKWWSISRFSMFDFYFPTHNRANCCIWAMHSSLFSTIQARRSPNVLQRHECGMPHAGRCFAINRFTQVWICASRRFRTQSETCHQLAIAINEREMNSSLSSSHRSQVIERTRLDLPFRRAGLRALVLKCVHNEQNSEAKHARSFMK